MIVKLKSEAFFKNYTESKCVDQNVSGNWNFGDSNITPRMLYYMGSEHKMEDYNVDGYRYKSVEFPTYAWPEWMVEHVKEG